MTVRSEVHKLINFVYNKEKLSQQCMEPIIVLIYKKCDKTDCSNYRSASLLSTLYRPLSIIVLSRLTQYVSTQRDLLRTISVISDVKETIHVRRSVIIRYFEYRMQ